MRRVRGWFRETTGGLPATFWYLWAGTLVNRMGAFVLVFLAIYLTEARGFDSFQAGLVLGMWGVGGGVGTMIGGVLTDRWGRRPTLLTGHLGAAAMMLALGLARELWLVAVSALLLALFAEAVRPAFSAMMIDVVPPADRMRAFSLNYWAINLGFACAAVLAGLAAEVSYLLLFVVDAATTLATAAIVFVRVRETRPATVAAPGRLPDPPTGGLRAVLADRVFLGFAVLNVFSALVFLQHISMLPIAMGDDGISPATYGSVIALNGVLIVAGQLFVPKLVGDRSRSAVLALASVVVGVGFGLTAFADVAWFYAITVLVWTLGEMLASPANSTLVAELSPAALRGRYQGVFSLSWAVATFAAPIGGGFVRESLGDPALWLGCAALSALVAVGQLLSGPARERRAALLRGSAGADRPALTDSRPGTSRLTDARPDTPAEAAGEPTLTTSAASPTA
ncbi:MAG TPA: MFS transporter [Micromonospora sp.]